MYKYFTTFQFLTSLIIYVSVSITYRDYFYSVEEREREQWRTRDTVPWQQQADCISALLLQSFLRAGVLPHNLLRVGASALVLSLVLSFTQ